MTSTTAEAEVRAEFDDWFRKASAKDLDGVMAKIAEDAVSFEHEVPLVYRGSDAIRQVCKRGFDAMPGDFRWDMPELQIVVRGDIAVTWGLNRMRAHAPGQDIELWSRGTRVFQRMDGGWKMIHQHVSFPYDPETGEARTDLKP